MAVKDYAHILDRMQRGIGRAYAGEPSVLNVPGQSAAVKIDAHYFLAAWPGSQAALARICGYPPGALTDALKRSGNLVCARQGGESLILRVNWGRPPRWRRLNSAFILAVFIESALKIYGGRLEPLPLSGLRIHGEDKAAVMRFFAGKTPPSETAFI
jgi:hypothetical protein